MPPALEINELGSKHVVPLPKAAQSALLVHGVGERSISAPTPSAHSVNEGIASPMFVGSGALPFVGNTVPPHTSCATWP